MKLSAVVIAKDEEKNIARCLSSLRFADEVVLVDSGSADRTAEIAKAHADKVRHRAFDNFSAQKNFAAAEASGEWVLSVDADEVVTPALAGEIRRIVESPDGCAAYAVRRRTRLFGRWFRFGGMQTDRPVRLFRKGSARFVGSVHERVSVDGRTGLLKQTLEHTSFQTLREYFRRLELYTALESAREDAPAPRASHFFARPVYRFVSVYLVKQAFRDGVEGFFYGVLSAYYEFIRWAKRWERQQTR
jgi:glycosyltransferase involved in cell wall biosynthesis